MKIKTLCDTEHDNCASELSLRATILIPAGSKLDVIDYRDGVYVCDTVEGPLCIDEADAEVVKEVFNSP